MTVTNASGAAEDPFGLGKLKEAFISADSATQLMIQEMMQSIRGRDYAMALGKLNNMAQNPNLTVEQKQAVNETITKLRRVAPR